MSDALRAGTTGQDGGDDAANAALAGTPETVGGNAGAGQDIEAIRAENERLRRIQEQALAERSTLERLKAENDLLKSQAGMPPTGYGNGWSNPQQQAAQRMQERMAQLQAQAAADPGSDAAIVLALYGQNMNLAQQVNTLQGLIAVPHDEQAEVLRIQNEARMRGEVISPATAKRLYEADRLAAQAGQVQTRENELRRVDEAKARGVVRTTTVGVPANEAGPRRMSSDDFDREWEKATLAQRNVLSAQIDSGALQIDLS